MQSIWYGMIEKFDSSDKRQKLIKYTKKAIDFAVAIECSKLVFGCPKNRVAPHGRVQEIFLPIASDFFMK